MTGDFNIGIKQLNDWIKHLDISDENKHVGYQLLDKILQEICGIECKHCGPRIALSQPKLELKLEHSLSLEDFFKNKMMNISPNLLEWKKKMVR